MENELEILKRRISELEFLESRHVQDEEDLRDVLQEAYNDIENSFETYIGDLISVNRRLIQEVEENRNTGYALYYRAELEKIIINLTKNFIILSQEKIHKAIKNALQEIGAYLGVDRCYIFLISRDKKRIGDIYEWCVKGIRPRIQELNGHLFCDEFPWVAKKIKRRGVLYVDCCDTLPPDAYMEKRCFQAHGIQTFIVIPILFGGSPMGCLGFDSVFRKKTWTVDIIAVLRILADIFANLLKRDQKQEAFR